MSATSNTDGIGIAHLNERLARHEVAEWLAALRDALAPTNASGWLVGGTVRDLLLDAPELSDLDVVVDGDSLAIARYVADISGSAFVVLDEVRGTARIVAPDGTHVDVNAMVGDSIEEDLRQRDLTINAMALPIDGDGVRNEVVDPCGGLADIEDQLIRLTSELSLAEDPLRALRVFRFSTTLGFIVVPETLASVASHTRDLCRVAPERIVTELSIILGDAGSSAVLRRMDEVGLLEAALPELATMRGVEQNEYHHLDVLDHSVLALDRLERLLADLETVFGDHAEDVDRLLRSELGAGRSRLVALKLATLFHDLGKPPTRSTDSGRTTFYHHNVEGAQLATDACRRLRLSNAETEEIAYYVYAHMAPGDVDKAVAEADLEGRVDAARRSLVRYAGKRGERGLVLALLAVADSMAMAGPLADLDRPERLRGFARRAAAAYYDEVAPRLASPPLIGGGDLMHEFGLEPGPRIGKALDRIREAQLEGRVSTRDEALALATKTLRD